MIHSVSALSTLPDSLAAAEEIGAHIRQTLGGNADALIVFASPSHDFSQLLPALARTCGTMQIAGSSSAGEFRNDLQGDGHVSVLAIRSPRMRFSVGLGRGIASDPAGAARQAVAAFRGTSHGGMPHRSALIMTDALAGHADAVVEAMTVATGGDYRFFGGGAGDDARFGTTHVFAGTEAVTNAIVALEILSMDPVGIGVSHGWEPAGEGLRVTESDGMKLISLNGAPAVDAFVAHAEATGQHFDIAEPLPFFLHNIIGIRGAAHYRLRVPLGVNDDGSLNCAADVPEGAIIHVMKTSESSSLRAAEQATRAALDALGSSKPGAAIVFDCVATRLRLGKAFDNELRACANLLRPADFIGCNTYGQIARAEGQFGGFHNCTAVVCVLPE